MEKVKIATISEIAEKGQIYRRLLGKSYLLRKEGEEYIVFEYICRHQGADLTQGREENGILTCPRHGWKYRMDTGENIEGDGRPLKRCPFEIVDGNLYLILGSGNQEY